MLETERMGKAGTPGALSNQRRGTSTVEKSRALVRETLSQSVEPPRRLRQTSLIAAQLAEINELNKAKSLRDLVEESLCQTLGPARQLGQASLTATQIQLDRAATVQDLIEEVLNQGLMPSEQIGNASVTDSERSSLTTWSKTVEKLVQEALNQTLKPPKQLEPESAKANKISAVDTWSKSVDELVQEALNQTLKPPKQSTAQPDKDIRQSISTMQKLTQAAQGIETRIEAMRTFSEEMNKNLPYNRFLEEMRREALIATKEIDDIVSQTELDGNRLFSDKGHSIQITLTDGAYIEVKAENLQLEAVEQAPTTRQDVEAFQLRLREKLNSVREYGKVLEQQSGQLAAEIKQTESKLVHDMGIGPNEVNTDMAAELAVLASSDMVSATMRESLDAQQVHGLLKDPVPLSLS